MAYIQPNSTIEIMVGVPLKSDYSYTVYFASEGAQASAFASKILYTYNAQMYQKPCKNKLRVECNSDNILLCNYLRFKNTYTLYPNMYFYAFITNIERLNINVVEITYSIDVMQTWMFFYNMGDCYIEREHIMYDTWGTNLVPEPFSINEHVLDGEVTISDIHHYGYILMIGTYSKANGQSSPLFSVNKATGFYSGFKYIYFSSEQDLQTFINGTTLLDGFLQNVFGIDEWTVEGLFAFPTALLGGMSTADNYTLVGTEPYTTSGSIGLPTYISGYLPRNKKLLTYPYTFITLNGIGNKNNYKYENFWDSEGHNVNPTFRLISIVNPVPSITVYPAAYEGADRPDMNIVINEFPMVNIYISSALTALGYNIGTGIKSALLALASGGFGLLGGASNTGMESTALTVQTPKLVDPIKEVTNVDLQIERARRIEEEEEIYEPEVGYKDTPVRLGSSKSITGSGSANVMGLMSQQLWKIKIERQSIKNEVARRIDSFFDKYGYATEEVKTPNIAGGMYRQGWVYIKTQDFVVQPKVGFMPGADDASKISAVFNNGITFWSSFAAVGNYGASNLITSNNVGAGQAGGMIVGG